MLGVDVGPTDAALAADTTTAMQASHAMCLAIMLQTRCGQQSPCKGTMGSQYGATERKEETYKQVLDEWREDTCTIFSAFWPSPE